jgi:hypothetical protein
MRSPTAPNAHRRDRSRPPTAAPFYRGVPASEVIRALDDLDFGGIVEMDTLP